MNTPNVTQTLKKACLCLAPPPSHSACSLSLSPSLLSDSVCTSPSAVSTRRAGKAKRHRQSANTRPTTSKTNCQRRRSFVRGTSCSCCGRTSGSSSPAPLTCPFTLAHHLHTHTRQNWFGPKWRSWKATLTGASRKCFSTPCSAPTMWPSCLSALSRLVRSPEDFLYWIRKKSPCYIKWKFRHLKV